MSRLTVLRLVGVATIMTAASAAMAVGDPPVRLNKRAAATAYAGIRSLLTNDAIACPRGQAPVSGQITGGGAPGLGSRTTTILFDKGATVRIVKQWVQGGAGPGSATTTITCS